MGANFARGLTHPLPNHSHLRKHNNQTYVIKIKKNKKAAAPSPSRGERSRLPFVNPVKIRDAPSEACNPFDKRPSNDNSGIRDAPSEPATLPFEKSSF